MPFFFRFSHATREKIREIRAEVTTTFSPLFFRLQKWTPLLLSLIFLSPLFSQKTQKAFLKNSGFSLSDVTISLTSLWFGVLMVNIAIGIFWIRFREHSASEKKRRQCADEKAHKRFEDSILLLENTRTFEGKKAALLSLRDLALSHSNLRPSVLSFLNALHEWIAEEGYLCEKISDERWEVWRMEKKIFSEVRASASVQFLSMESASITEEIIRHHNAEWDSLPLKKRRILDFSKFLFPAADFSDSVLRQKKICFSGAKFFGRTNFENTFFRGKTDFSKAQFFGHTSFGEARFLRYVHFSESNFLHSASFFRVIFRDKADFSRAAFFHEIGFSSAIFEREVSFVAIRCNGEAWFDKISFRHKSDFSHSIFLQSVTFEKTIFTKLVSFLHGHFSRLPLFTRGRFRVSFLFSPEISFFDLPKWNTIVLHPSKERELFRLDRRKNPPLDMTDLERERLLLWEKGSGGKKRFWKKFW